MSVIAILAALPWGTVLGWFAAWLNRREELKRLTIEHQQRIELIRLEQAGALDAARWTAFTASQNAAAAEDGRGVWVWVKSLRYGTRMGLTWLLVVAAVVIALRSGAASTLSERIQFFAEMALGWWFGASPTRPGQSTK